ncbi:hypothetical protein THAOC_08245 [Thalassiosira oceanica]|uniref:Uncharacterized protein n=1 Tax=Thalassiosira oceanica TaxID=159749 RepID=K0SZH1_THAOC|nr:hypothetical protein THAOC_08245 [Thalassiosira oceanica]|eukprot:EJK70399.1 hypothetical protein THAOC_08245 [Thalassiosira oceanica]
MKPALPRKAIRFIIGGKQLDQDIKKLQHDWDNSFKPHGGRHGGRGHHWHGGSRVHGHGGGQGRCFHCYNENRRSSSLKLFSRLCRMRALVASETQVRARVATPLVPITKWSLVPIAPLDSATAMRRPRTLRAFWKRWKTASLRM